MMVNPGCGSSRGILCARVSDAGWFRYMEKGSLVRAAFEEKSMKKFKKVVCFYALMISIKCD